MKDPAKPSHLAKQKRVLAFLKAPAGLTIHEAHVRLIKCGLMTQNSDTPLSWDELSDKIPSHLTPSCTSVTFARQEPNRIQEATFA